MRFKVTILLALKSGDFPVCAEFSTVFQLILRILFQHILQLFSHRIYLTQQRQTIQEMLGIYYKLLQLHTTTTNAKKARTQNCHYVSSYPVRPVHITTTIHDALTLIQINIHLLPAGTSIDCTQVHEPGDCAPPPPSTPRPSCYSAMYRSTEGSGGRQRRRLLPS